MFTFYLTVKNNKKIPRFNEEIGTRLIRLVSKWSSKIGNFLQTPNVDIIHHTSNLLRIEGNVKFFSRKHSDEDETQATIRRFDEGEYGGKKWRGKEGEEDIDCAITVIGKYKIK